MIVFAVVFLLAAVPGSGEGGHKKGFLAFEPGESVNHDFHEPHESLIHPSLKERRLWDDFQESERRLNHGKSGDILMEPPAGPIPQSHIAPVDYTVEILIGSPPCEKKIQKCEQESMFCRRMLEDLGTKIAASASKLQNLANNNALLNTLQIRSDVQTKAPLIEFAKNVHVTRTSKQTSSQAPQPSQNLFGTFPKLSPSPPEPPGAPGPPLWARINPVMKPVDTVSKVDWAARLNKAEENLKKTEEKIDRGTQQPYLHQEFRSPLWDGMEQLPDAFQKKAPDIAKGIAQHIAEVLPKRVVQAAANQLNPTCSGMQTLMLDDCLSFAQACKDDLDEKKHRFRALSRTIHQHEEERQKY